MHSKPMSESEGEFQGDWQPAENARGPWPCPHCKVAGQVKFKLWESNDGGHEDINYHCAACGRTWWVEGDDG